MTMSDAAPELHEFEVVLRLRTLQPFREASFVLRRATFGRTDVEGATNQVVGVFDRIHRDEVSLALQRFLGDVQRDHWTLKRVHVDPCPCECSSGTFCGGCGHAGCGFRG